MRLRKIIVPPDKSISHRAIMLASVSESVTCIKNLLIADDCLWTIATFRAMGVEIDIGKDVRVHGVGMHGLKEPRQALYLGNSGTTMRILPGILAGQNFQAVLKGDRSLTKRPMKRIVEPLRKMGVFIRGQKDIYPPLIIHGGRLKPIRYKSNIASAQVKSCILLAGLFANGVTSVTEPVKSRDHTERMLKRFGCKLKVKGLNVSLKGPVRLKSPNVIEIPGDISSAAFFIVAGCILLNTKIIIENVGLNPTRTGVIDILKRMGAEIKITHNARLPAEAKHESCLAKAGRKTQDEPSGDIVVKYSKLRGTSISAKEVVRAIDEIPILMLAACFAKGRTVIRGIGELRVKETDRIKAMVTNLQKLGADIKVIGDGPALNPNEVSGSGLSVIGGKELHGGRVSSFGDHRTAMSMLVAGLAIKGKVTVTGKECINKSFPNFEKLLHNLH